MFLKGHLSTTTNLDDLKKLGHRLRRIWKRFKVEVGDPSLDRFNPTITGLDRFERIRYPDKLISLGMRAVISFDQRHDFSAESPARPEPTYEVAVKEIDDLRSSSSRNHR
jgi:hypothetical protein